ncbi:unnamed protein product [Spirodela intermedia]|uniref:Uncharacterized protein n=1 Tax=Spirodela intermedia TaxID=51605 RepID=A0A7I8JUI1_SPIIN|nr:unnamed protein product [Spirodela intermedia]CAA6673122.1 unnamed protein product [Spirodela intermedia]
MASVVEDFCEFQADCPSSSSVSFGRFEAEPLSWERKSSFSHNRYLEEVEKYSTPGSVTEKKAYFEAHFKRTALRNLIAIERQNEAEEQEKNGIEDQDTSIEEITKHGNVSTNSEDFAEHGQHGIQFSWHNGSPNDDQNEVMETRKEEQTPPPALRPKVENNNLKASPLKSGKNVETGNNDKANASTKSLAMDKVRASSLKKTIRSSHMDFDKTTDKARAESKRDEHLTTTMRLPSRTSTRAFNSKCSERIEQRNEAKIETKQLAKRINLKAASTPFSSHKPNPKLICGKKVINGSTHILPPCRNQAIPPSLGKSLKLQGLTTTSDEHRSVVRSESHNRLGKLEAFGAQKQASGPSKAVGAVKREGDKVKATIMQRWDAAGKEGRMRTKRACHILRAGFTQEGELKNGREQKVGIQHCWDSFVNRLEEIAIRTMVAFTSSSLEVDCKIQHLLQQVLHRLRR